MERGGPANQSGILYQNSIAALYLGRLCDSTPRPDEHAVEGVRVEAPTAVDDIVVTYRDGHRTFIQAKENVRANDSAWQEIWSSFERQFWQLDFQKGKDRLLVQIGEVHNEHHAVREIGIRAAGSFNYAEWISRLTEDQKKLLKKILALFDPKHAAAEEILSFFKHFDLEIRPLIDVERDLVRDWIPQSNKTQIELFKLLRDAVGGAARRRDSFSMIGLSARLAAESNVIFAVQPDLDELLETVRGCGAGLKQHKRSFGNTGIHLKRAVVEVIKTWILEPSDRPDDVGILLDRAGMGKTVVLQDVLYALEDAGVRVLAIKADLLSGISTREELRDYLGLPDSVERVLHRLADRETVVLLIDQMDALSISLAPEQRTLDLVLDVVAKARLIPRVRVLLSCRTFVLNNTPKLSEIESRKFPVAELAVDEVREVFDKLDFQNVRYERLSPATQQLLRVPLHLDLFIRILSERASHPVTSDSAPREIESLQDLYSLLWQTVVRKNDPEGPLEVHRELVLRLITEEMNPSQRTTVTQSLFSNQSNELQGAVRWLASQGILIPNDALRAGVEWTFLHQTFFDYCYAKYFLEDGKSLYQTVRDGDQGLFARPQVIHVLEYLRGTNPSTSIRELNSLLNASPSELRFHLRDHILRWFGSVYNPTEDEWLIAQRMLANQNRRASLLAVARGNPGWFKRFKDDLKKSLDSDKDEILDNETIPFLYSMADGAQSETIGMLRPYRGKSRKWDERVANITRSIRVWKSEEGLALFEEVFRAAPVARLGDFYQIHDLAKEQPKAGCRLIRIAFDHILDEQLSSREIEGEQRPWLYNFPAGLEILNGSAITEALNTVTRVEPKYFLEMMLPWLERVTSIKAPRFDDAFLFTGDALSNSWHGSPYVVHHEINKAFIIALTELARQSAPDFLSMADRLEALPYSTPQRYLAHAYCNLAEVFSKEALDFLTADQRRLDLGDHQQYDTRQLIKAIIPHLSEELILKLEAAILRYEPIHKYRGVRALRWRGLEKLYLLQCLPIEGRSERGLKELHELERKFPGMRASDDPGTAKGGFVGPPIPDDIAKKMSDKAWLRAMTKYRGSVEHRDFLKGGAHQQGAVLSRLVKTEPERFFQLAMRAPLDTDQPYVCALINGLAESSAPAERTFDVVRRFEPLAARETKQAIAWALEKRVDDGIPEDLIAVLKGYLQDGIGDDESSWLREEETNRRDGRPVDLGGPDSSYLNSVRGNAMMTLMRTFDHQGDDATRRKWAIIDLVAKDESTALRAGALQELPYLIDSDRFRAFSTFERIMKGHPSLFRSHDAGEFLYYGFVKNYLRMRPYILMMMNDDNESVQQRGAELACIAAISPRAMESDAAHLAAEVLAQETLTGPAPWRRGAAHIYSVNLGMGAEGCVEALTKLLDDDDEEVRKFASGSFLSLRAQDILSIRPFLDTYAASRSIKAGFRDFTEFLWKYGAVDPVWALSIVETVLNNPHTDQSSMHYGGGEELVRLVLRVYTDPTVEVSTREHAMDVFDQLMEKSSWAAYKVLAEWDRR